MDMWKPFRTVTERAALQAAILSDKFHVLRHVNEAMDPVRKAEYQRLQPPRSDVHQGAEVCPTLAPGQSLAGEAAPAADAPGDQQATPHGLRPQGTIRATVGVPARTLDAKFFDPWYAIAAMAVSETVRKVCSAL